MLSHCHMQHQETEQLDTCRRRRLIPPSNLFKSRALTHRQLIPQLQLRMSQEKPIKFEAIKYGDVFDVSGELAAKPITPKDAAAVESAENRVLGKTPKSGMASVMKSAAELNERRGFVGHDDMTDAVRDSGTYIAETTIVGHRLISESIGGQLLGRFAMDER